MPLFTKRGSGNPGGRRLDSGSDLVGLALPMHGKGGESLIGRHDLKGIDVDMGGKRRAPEGAFSNVLSE